MDNLKILWTIRKFRGQFENLVDNWEILENFYYVQSYLHFKISWTITKFDGQSRFGGQF